MRNGWYPATTAEPRSCVSFETLNSFWLLNVVANINVCDYVSMLEQKTDPWGTEWLPDQYKAFGRMSRQWAYLKQMKRSGVGNLWEGVDSAEQGLVAVPCWACPRDGVNLLPGWQDMPPEVRYVKRCSPLAIN